MEGGGNSNEQKAAAIRKWIDPEERITVQFDDQRDLSAEVTACTDQVVSLSLDTAVPHMRQEITLPLSASKSRRIFPTIRAIQSVRSSGSG